MDVEIDAGTFGADVHSIDVRIDSSPLELRHTQVSPDAAPAQLVLVMQSHGSSRFEQQGWQLSAGPGEIFLATTEFALTASAAGKRSWMSLTIPYDDLHLPRAVIRDALGRRLGADHPVAPVAARYLRDLPIDGSAPGVLPAFRDPTVALIRALVATTAGDEFRAREPLGETIFDRAMAYVRLHATQPGLTPDHVATALGISKRYLYLILARHQVSLSDTVRDLRLSAAKRMLCSTTLTVSAVAHAVGFADHAHFTRTFRRVYGRTPSDWRRARPDAGAGS
ncbi:helix-turn-helix domain-containing protein [Dactylosporangium sp. CA-092794]|uniref:helix-turn-helix domain-containing protein n=1 Tax=Dactylosporangium sp. CA-092794 TaxID=3239929 RepID=UPI003D8B945E